MLTVGHVGIAAPQKRDMKVADGECGWQEKRGLLAIFRDENEELKEHDRRDLSYLL